MTNHYYWPCMVCKKRYRCDAAYSKKHPENVDKIAKGYCLV